jgi:glycosyltransferase involved in cell wall biosynthesis
VGDGPLAASLRALADHLGVADRVHWAGRQRDPATFVADSDIVVLPSRFEGFPNALAEAMAAGRAVVATDCRSGPRELIDDGRNGLLVPVEDSEALARAITRLVRDPAERSRMAAAAPGATRRLQLSAIAATWDALFAELRTTQR